MTRNEQIYTAKAMKRFGGSFVKALGEALLLADEENADRIANAFPHYMEKYGPPSAMYAEIEREARA